MFAGQVDPISQDQPDHIVQILDHPMSQILFQNVKLKREQMIERGNSDLGAADPLDERGFPHASKRRLAHEHEIQVFTIGGRLELNERGFLAVDLITQPLNEACPLGELVPRDHQMDIEGCAGVTVGDDCMTSYEQIAQLILLRGGGKQLW